MNQDFCELVGRVAAFLDDHPDGADRLREFMREDKLLLNTEDMVNLTGWARTYLSRLCTSGRMPHIPGKPTRFIREDVIATLRKMQTGGDYGRRKGKPFKGTLGKVKG